MGLDITEFVISVEEAFRLTIPDKDAQEIATPRHLIDYIAQRLPSGQAPHCLSQRAFYRLRRVLSRRPNVARNVLVPDTRLLDILPKYEAAERWRAIGDELGMGPDWPRLRGWFRSGPPFRHIRGVVQFLVSQHPSLLLHPGEGWTRPMIAKAIHGLICETFGMQRDQYTEDSHFVKDMGLG